MSDKFFDIAIVGGGMVGAALACALKDTSLKIALIDASEGNQDDPRLIALNHHSINFFKNLRLWESLQNHAEIINEVHISDRGNFGKVRLRAQEISLNELGYVVPSKHINHILYSSLTNTISLYRPQKLQQLTYSEKNIHLTLDKAELSAALVIGADGIDSTVREQLEIETETFNYNQSALVTITDLNRAHENIAHERFHQGGVIAMLPLQNNRCATILTGATETINALKQLSNAEFTLYLQDLFGYQLGKLNCPNQRYIFPLFLQKAKQLFKNNTLLIGNAVHNLHPVAAQGLNLSIAEIAKLVQEISLQKNNLSAINLENYFSWQKQQESLSTRFSHDLPSIFASDFPLTKYARQLALIGLNLCRPLKNRFTQRAIGRRYEVPSLLID